MESSDQIMIKIRMDSYGTYLRKTSAPLQKQSKEGKTLQSSFSSLELKKVNVNSKVGCNFSYSLFCFQGISEVFLKRMLQLFVSL